MPPRVGRRTSREKGSPYATGEALTTGRAGGTLGPSLKRGRPLPLRAKNCPFDRDGDPARSGEEEENRVTVGSDTLTFAAV